MKRLVRAARRGLWLSLVLVSLPGAAAAPLDVMKVDLHALIRAAASSPNQFAVPVAHPVSAATAGTWSIERGRALWRYRAEVPSAVSLSFLASRVVLPPSATLTVRGGSASTSYQARDVHRGQLWSRISAGQVLEFTLEVDAAERGLVVLEIAAFQAGFRALGGGVQDHPDYLKLQGTAGSNSACVRNYACGITGANSAPAQATVGLVISNLYQCTGTLINDIPGDNTPYVLTARHCQSGKLGGGNPAAAGAVTVYWNAVTACGQSLGSLYDPNIPTQSGSRTVVEQQDAWLIRLDASPVAAGAQFAGFDARGAAVEGGYAIHHALGFNKQLTSWFGSALSLQQPGVLGVSYLSDFWEVVNQQGNGGPGDSGAGLFDQNNHLVGSLSLGRNTADSSGYESCPAPQPAAPDGTNGTNDFTSLAAVWGSTADATGSAATLRSVLDPAGTGVLQMGSAAAASMSLTASLTSAAVGTTAQLAWNAPNATQCTPAGGSTGDGWTGSVAAAGTQVITESAPARVNYSLTCALPGGRSISAAVLIDWGAPPPTLTFSAPGIVWTGRPARLTWTSNEAPCALSGGALALTGLGASGSVTTTADTPASVQYQLSCGGAYGPGATATTSVLFVPPAVGFTANGTDRLLGEEFYLQWQSYADSCTPSGGAPGDGWTGAAFPDPANPARFDPVVTGTGTYTYTLTCFSGPVSVSQGITVRFEQDAPFVSASIDRTSGTFTGTAADFFDLTWNSNLSSCYLESDPQVSNLIAGHAPQDGARIAPTPGTYTLDVLCSGNGTGRSAASPPFLVTVLAPPAPTATIAVSPGTVTTGAPFTVSWASTYASDCEAAGAPPDVLWRGSQTPSGTQSFSSSAVGEFAFTISCRGLWGTLPPASAQATVMLTSPPVLSVSLWADATRVPAGAAFTLTWTSQNVSSCMASGGGASGARWSGALPTAGSAAELGSVAGTFTYIVACEVGTQSVQAQTTVTVTAKKAAGRVSGGGGALDLLLLAVVGVLSWLKSWRQQRDGRHSIREAIKVGACA